MKTYVFEVTPVAKPRMTRRDKWAQREVVLRYFAYKDSIRWQALSMKFKMPESHYHLRFYLPLPSGLSKRIKELRLKSPHQLVPDKDNLEKGFLDALCDNDAYIWDGRVSKFWSENDTGRIEIDVYEPHENP